MAASFESFYNGWLTRQQEFLRQLESLSSPVDGGNRIRECSEIIPRVFAHYHEFYSEKAAAAARDVFQVMSPPWLSSYERTLLWISGFRPSLFFVIANRAVAPEELTEEQRGRIEDVKGETRRMEKEIGDAMARLQERVAEQPLCRLYRRFGRRTVDGERPGLDNTMEEFKAAMVVIVRNADILQGWTVAEVVAAMNPVQGVKFLAALARFQLRARALGAARDSQRESAAAGPSRP